MVRPLIRRRADSGNIDRHTHRAMTAMDVPCKLASPTSVQKERGRRHGRCSVCPTANDRKIDWIFCQCSKCV